jgi:hypothetical protein
MTALWPTGIGAALASHRRCILVIFVLHQPRPDVPATLFGSGMGITFFALRAGILTSYDPSVMLLRASQPSADIAPIYKRASSL